MKVYIVEFRFKARSGRGVGRWAPCPGFVAQFAGRDCRKVEIAVERYGLHDNCEYRVVPYYSKRKK